MKASGSSKTVCPSVSLLPAPLAINMTPRVMIKAGTRNVVTRTPVANPMLAQTTTAARQQRIMAGADAARAPANSRISSVDSTADRASRLPTDRSMPPAMMTIVMPIAMIAMTAI